MTEQQELRSAAEVYHELGMTIIPFYINPDVDANGVHDKKPKIITYAKWQTTPQTNDEFNALEWKGCNGFGILLGKKTNDRYLTVIDYDTKNNFKNPDDREAYQKAIIKGKEIFDSLPVSMTEKTVNDGLHKLYWSKTKPKTDGSYHDTAALELLGENKLCVMCPSFGYKNVGSDIITEIDDVGELFYSKLKEFGFNLDEEAAKQNKLDVAIFDIRKLIDISKLNQQTDPNEYQGSHPIHDSTTEKNFSVNVKYNNWYCFRHNSGGGALQYFAMQQGLIKCEQAKRGALRGKKFRETVRLAKAQGLIKQEDMPLENEESQADRLVKLFLMEDEELFFDQHNTAYTRVKLEVDPLRNCATCETFDTFNPPSHKNTDYKNNEDPLKASKIAQIPQLRNTANIIMSLGSSQFKNYLAYLMYQAENKTPGSDSLTSAINVLKGKAQNEGKQYRLYNRVAPAKDGIWLDMCDSLWRAIKITPEGWEIVNDPPILFKRYSHQQPLAEPLPREQGDAWKILDYVNIKKTDNNSQLMFLCSHISYWIPLIAHPAIVASGPQGCCKSWLFMLIRRISDPSSIELLRIPKNEEDLALQLEHHWLTPYDNISYLPGWASDMLCCAITGGGIAKRKLYTDEDDVILQFKRCVLLNGINIAAQKGDLLDRAIIFVLAPIEQHARKTESELNQDFEKDKPIIFTGYLNVLSQALKLYPTIVLKEKQRLSDFDVYGCAIAQALGKTQDDFTNAYAEKVTKQNEEALNSDSVALLIQNFAEKEVKNKKMTAAGDVGTDFWKGTPTELYNKLCSYAQYFSINVKAKTWPKNANALTRRINQVIPALKFIGIEIESYEGTPRKISIDAKKLKTGNVPAQESGTAVTGSENLGEQQQTAETEDSGLRRIEPIKPTWFVKNIPQGAKCECGRQNVTLELVTPQKEVIKRCAYCLEDFKQKFKCAVFQPAYSEMPSYEDKEAP